MPPREADGPGGGLVRAAGCVLWRRAPGAPGGVEIALVHRPKSWSEQSIVLLVMQTLNNSLELRRRRFLPGLRSSGSSTPPWIPAGHEVARRVAKRIRGVPVGAASSLVNIPVTGHFLGGAVLAIAGAQIALLAVTALFAAAAAIAAFSPLRAVRDGQLSTDLTVGRPAGAGDG